MKRKKITGALILAFLLFVLTSCAGSTESGISSGKAASSSESGKETMTSSASSETEDENSIVLAKVEAEYAIDVSEPKVLRDNVSHVFVARVKSIDGCSNTDLLRPLTFPSRNFIALITAFHALWRACSCS